MRNPFAKPHTPGQWLLGSVCWFVSCLSCWVVLTCFIEQLPYAYQPQQSLLLLINFIGIYGLAWEKVELSEKPKSLRPSIIKWLAVLWVIALRIMRVLWLVAGFILWAFSLPDKNSF